MKEPKNTRGASEDGDCGAFRRIICTIVAAVFAIAAVVLAVLFFAKSSDVLLIPAAVCGVVALISFTFARTAS